MRWLKIQLTRIGERLSPKTLHRLNATLNYLEVGQFLRAHGFEVPARVADRSELYQQIAAPLAKTPVLFLEFGVHEGASLRSWANLLEHPDSRLHGFDSFEGLPEDWNHANPQGTFSTERALPEIADDRVSLFVGWFKDTLPDYSLPPCGQLILHFDADLYSSTIIALRHLRPHIVAGTILLFDEFCDRDHELRAFKEFMAESGMRFRLLAAEATLARVAFARVED